MKYLESFNKLGNDDINQINDLFVPVSDTWNIIPLKEYESGNEFNGDFIIDIEGECIELSFDTPNNISKEMEISLNTFLKRLIAYKWEYNIRKKYTYRFIENKNTEMGEYIKVMSYDVTINRPDDYIIERFLFFKKKPHQTLEEKKKLVEFVINKHINEDILLDNISFSSEYINLFTFYWNNTFTNYEDYYVISRDKVKVNSIDGKVQYKNDSLFKKCIYLYNNQTLKLRFYSILFFLLYDNSKNENDWYKTIYFNNVSYIRKMWDKFNSDNIEYTFYKYPNIINSYRMISYIQDENNITFSKDKIESINRYINNHELLKDIRII